MIVLTSDRKFYGILPEFHSIVRIVLLIVKLKLTITTKEQITSILFT